MDSDRAIERASGSGRGDNDAPASRSVLIALLGGFRVVKSGAALPLSPDAKSALLLRQLALHSRTGVTRESLIELLWPDAGTDEIGGRFHTLLTEVRTLLRDALDDASPVINGDGCYRLNAAAGIAVDVDLFDAHVEAGHRAFSAARDTDAREAYQRALELYRGDLYLGRGLQDDVHAFVEQERLRSRCLTTLSRAAELAGRAGDMVEAMALSRRLLEIEPCSEVGHRLVMHLYMLRGQRAHALRQHRVCAEALRREYDIAPEAATEAMAALVRGDGWTEVGGCGLIGS